ncbi:uncharacterized protein [Physcomitrium patens]|uniref:uncharacterized protein isoform X1 n=1 Tax=Physcomitrium patens TaxID=3218 RepID=UPI003CCE41E8
MGRKLRVLTLMCCSARCGERKHSFAPNRPYWLSNCGDECRRHRITPQSSHSKFCIGFQQSTKIVGLPQQ